ncbi:hypothetical protein [Shewanella salipaludis]|uniref:Uncharacterized protein n=1 Tax=Shewanella salipaludis TaxID=2723052 RepID=A0A972JID9_9GAMM|nr:hypothetical protein [Shewanella salipaludis]NMH64913.1 hypothetical protein [Shewanella salipaludis]
MDIAIPEIVKENTITFGIGLTVALIGVAVRVVKGLIDFYEEVFVKRYFKRLISLNEHLDEESVSGRYLKLLKENEIFRLASGVKSTPENNNILMEIYILGVASNGELKRLSQYIRSDNMKAAVEVDWFDKLQFTYSFFAATFLFLFGMIMGSANIVMGTGVESIAGFFVMIMFILIAAVVGRDYRTYRILKRVRERLVSLNMVANPDISIQWNFNRLLRAHKIN